MTRSTTGSWRCPSWSRTAAWTADLQRWAVTSAPGSTAAVLWCVGWNCCLVSLPCRVKEASCPKPAITSGSCGRTTSGCRRAARRWSKQRWTTSCSDSRCTPPSPLFLDVVSMTTATKWNVVKGLCFKNKWGLKRGVAFLESVAEQHLCTCFPKRKDVSPSHFWKIWGLCHILPRRATNLSSNGCSCSAESQTNGRFAWQVEELKNDNALLRAQLQQHGVETNGDVTAQWRRAAPSPTLNSDPRDSGCLHELSKTWVSAVLLFNVCFSLREALRWTMAPPAVQRF